MKNYVPSSIIFEKVKTLKSGKEVFIPHCPVQYKPYRINSVEITSEQVEFDSFSVYLDDGKDVYGEVMTENGPVIVGNNSFTPGLITNLIVENSISEDMVVNSKIGFQFSTSRCFGGSNLCVTRSDTQEWKGLMSGRKVGKELKSKDLKIGNIYSQIGSDSIEGRVYLGRVRDPSNGDKLSYCFMLVDNLYGRGFNSNDFKSLCKKSFSSFFNYKEIDIETRRRRQMPKNRIMLSPSVPRSIYFDEGPADLGSIIPKLKGLTPEGIETLIAEVVKEQWGEYEIYSEIRKANGSNVKSLYGGGTTFTWRSAEAPVWVTWKKRIT